MHTPNNEQPLATMDDAMEPMREAAREGSLEAQLCLGYSLCTHKGKRRGEGAKWLKMAAEQGDAGAQVQLAYMYSRGYGVANDLAATVHWLGEAALQGHPLAVACLSGGADCDSEQERHKRIAAMLGGKPRPLDEGAKLALKDLKPKPAAAKEGVSAPPPDEFFEGISMLQRAESAGEVAEAVRHLCVCAGMNYVPAQFMLGRFFFDGHGVRRDYVKAYRWFNLAAANGFKGGIKAREMVAKKMTRAQLAEALAQIRKTQQGMEQPAPGHESSPMIACGP